MTEMIFSFDTEDFVTPESDDALLAIAEMLSRHGIRGSFAIVGDKARALWTRGRRNVIDAVARHDVQYHANTHLIWPQTTLELSRLGWDEGVDLVMDSERHGIEDVAEAFDQRPVAWIRCGGNWDPRLLYGLNLLGIRGYVPSQFLLPGGAPIWYDNTLNYPYSIAIEHYYALATAADDLRAEVMRQKEADGGKGIPIVAFAHPCIFTCATFYDLHNQTAPGVFPPKREWRPAPLLPRAEVQRRLALLEGLVAVAEADPEIEIVTHREFIRRREEQHRWLSREEVLSMARAVRSRFDYLRLGSGYLSPADAFAVLSLALTRSAASGSLPAEVPVRHIIGPPEPAGALEAGFATTVQAVIAACVLVEEEIDRSHRMPSGVTLDGRAVPPTSFLMALADAVIAIGAESAAPIPVEPAPAYPAAKTDIYRDVRVRSSELPDDFEEGTIVTHTHLQTWTARPAVRQ
ncbi:MAG: hypothetical protein ACYC5O_10520 [Anaerolineae bacterium]